MIRYLIAALIACLILIYGGWQRIESQARGLAAATDQISTLNKAVESRRKTQQLLTQIDTEKTKVLIDAQAQNKALLARVGTGAQRLSVPARCPVVRAGSVPTGLDNAEERAELDPAAAQRILATANDGDEAIIALTALQEWVSAKCLGVTP
ncbi:lysis protein [Pseudomonas sp. ICBG1301]|uniref:lysis system i-spanin subunit Rz n=1 Tax=Bacteria TaxID=2 RepID=UPI000F8656FD|nr:MULTISPECIES: lysis system i-spanin subunit Rz [Bacteria]MBM9486990.1 lysis protein [Pseudomonas sp. ICBG1301]RUP88034.1 lysis protein [Corynebacterium pseudodiphtheriticum]